MKVKFSLFSLAFLTLWTGAAAAQSVAAECPNLPQEAADSLKWQVTQMPTSLLCRAMRTDNGEEAFALTISTQAPFKLDSAMRDKEGTLEGQKMWWYRSEIAGRPDEQVRETMVKLGSNKVVHAFIRTDNSDTLNHYMQMVQGLRFNTAFAGTP